MKHVNDLRREAVERVQVLRRDATFNQKLKVFLKVFLPLAFIVLPIGVVAFLILTRPEPVPRPIAERMWTVETIPATVANVQPDRRFFGRVVAGREVDLRTEVAGRVVEVSPSFVDGGVVGAGDLLVRIDPFDYEAAVRETEADLKGARGLLERDHEQIELRRRDVARRERLKGRGAGSVKTLDDSKLQLSEAEQRIIDRTNRIERLEVALARARRNLEETRVLAPFDGFLVGATAAVGKFLREGDSLGKAINAKRLEIRFLVSNAEFERFLSNGRYKDRTAAVQWSGQRFAARLDRVESEVQAASGGVEIFARLEGVDAASSLRPGAFVEISVPGPQFEGVIRIPEVALYGGETVYRIVEGRLDPVKVTVAGRSGKDLFVRGAFAPDDRIVTTRFPEAGPGIKVRLP
jgi:RND family efflux transporter MFP subunit